MVCSESEQRQVALITFRLVKQNLFERSNWANLHGAARLRNNFCQEKNYITFKNSSFSCYNLILKELYEYVLRCLKTVWNF